MVAMKHLLALLLVLLGFGGAIASQGLSVALAAGPHAALLDIDDTIHSVTARFLSRGVDTATANEASLLIVVLNTPGGLYDSTRDMVAAIQASSIPVVVYVSPSGAHAASAGTFITVSAHVAAMAPGTNIGAASPVGGGGEDLPETLEAKAKQDAAAFIRSIAEERGRNAAALEESVLSSVSYTATEALDNDIIDLIAKDIDDLMAMLDGRTVQLKDGAVVLQTSGLEIQEIERTPVERFIGFLANPDVAFLLLSLGMLGLFIEFMSPGLLGPGIVGAIALALAFVAIGNLPVNWAGVGLLALSIVLLFLELQAPGIGIFGISGAISFVLGAFLLFGGFSPPPITTPSFRVNVWLIVGTAVALFGFLGFVLRDMISARRSGSKAPTTPLSLLGQVGTVSTVLNPHGTIQVASELWSAVSDTGDEIPEGEEVMVTEVDGLTLKVFRPPDLEGEAEKDVPP